MDPVSIKNHGPWENFQLGWNPLSHYHQISLVLERSVRRSSGSILYVSISDYPKGSSEHCKEIQLSTSYDHELYFNESILEGALSYEEVQQIRRQ